MKRIPPIAAIAVAVFGIIGLALGGRIFRWEVFIWAGTVIIFSLALIGEQHTHELDRKTIEWQATVLRNQADMMNRMLWFRHEDTDGRD